MSSTKKITCRRCGKTFLSLGYARHRAMHFDRDQKQPAVVYAPEGLIPEGDVLTLEALEECLRRAGMKETEGGRVSALEAEYTAGRRDAFPVQLRTPLQQIDSAISEN